MASMGLLQSPYLQSQDESPTSYLQASSAQALQFSNSKRTLSMIGAFESFGVPFRQCQEPTPETLTYALFVRRALIALPHYDFALKGRYDKFSYTF